MTQSNPLPVLPTVFQSWRLLWRHRLLHAKAIWPPVVFLVAAEFLYHRIFGNADSVDARWQALLAHPWWMPALAAICWLAGLKFLLSFSISWRRHLLLREPFDPFFFKAPFWKYLGLLLLTYAWLLALSSTAVFISALIGPAMTHGSKIGMAIWFGMSMLLAGWVILWGIARQVPFFTALCLDPPHPAWRDSVTAMRGQVLRYLAIFILAMLPVILANAALDEILKLVDANRHAAPVALGESAFRQAMLFVHFSLGASIGALVFVDRFTPPPNEIATAP